MSKTIILLNKTGWNPSDGTPSDFHLTGVGLAIGLLTLILLLLFVVALQSYYKARRIGKSLSRGTPTLSEEQFKRLLNSLEVTQLENIIKRKLGGGKSKSLVILLCALLGLMLSGNPSYGQISGEEKQEMLLGQGGVIITIILLAIPCLTALVILIYKVRNSFADYQNDIHAQLSAAFLQRLESMDITALKQLLEAKRRQNGFVLSASQQESSGLAKDDYAILNIQEHQDLPLFTHKQKAVKRPAIDPGLAKLICWYLISAVAWLLVGTSVGEYLGIKFVAPDVDGLRFLSFGRLRPVHTNAVFWGWASIAMLGLGHYVIPRICNAPLASLKAGWIALVLMNSAVLLGSLCLMSGINNGGGEYREYVWPVMMVFASALVISMVNFLRTVAVRKSVEIYISAWYIISALIFVLVITLVAYLPFWQDGLGETIVQGYYMHQGVGMWFMLFTLGLVYYFLPQQLNRPIYSYSLGILAFWTQILFYTTIGTHHFVFSAIPWWLQTVAIVGSVGMIIPVAAGTTNFLMTFKGAFNKLGNSYTLPFFLVGIIFYFTGSLQGTAEAFRYTNLLWHFTDFTVAHSHLTMYGIISFLLWACIYTIAPRLTGQEPPQGTVGAHFWLALIGLLLYTVPLMYGSTLRGMMWMDGKPFIDSVIFMAPYWLWRAIGGSLMWVSHLFFAYNVYKILAKRQHLNIEALDAVRVRDQAKGIQ